MPQVRLSERNKTLGVMRWQPRRWAGMTTVFWAHLAAMEQGEDGETGSSGPGRRRRWVWV